MKRILLLLLLPLLQSVTLLPAEDRPNVIVVITDDQGYPDLSCHGNPILKTPHLDKLHRQSVRLTDFHVAPMCTPTRGQLLTGLDAARNGAINVSSGRTLLRADLPTMADLLRGAGYQTGIFGKWHLGDNFPFRPQDRGFEETLWFPSSHINSAPDVWNNDYFDDTYMRNGERESYEGYCTDIFFDEAIKWMAKRVSGDEPFFAYIPTNAPHGPYWVPEKYRDMMTKEFSAAHADGRLGWFEEGLRYKLITFLAMIANIDDNIGKLMQFLDESGIADNTILIFLTDNGSTMGERYYDAGMRGRKTQLWEGGHRVPCFVRWPEGRFGESRDLGGLTQVQDLLPTILDFCEVNSGTKFDGISLASALRGEELVPEDRMIIINYSRMPRLDYPMPDSPSIMRREGAGVLWKRWRLLEDKELYDLASDPKQARNVITEHPAVVKKMRAELDAWWEEVGAMANEPQPVVIGHEAENPMMLTACEWLDVFIDQQGQIRRGIRKNGWWELKVAEAGEYEFELRRFPRESGLTINAASPRTEIADGIFEEGRAIPIKKARMQIGTEPAKMKSVTPRDESAIFSATLKPGHTRLYTWFLGENGDPLVGAYYVYVNRKKSN